jgi:hypothetical protein
MSVVTNLPYLRQHHFNKTRLRTQTRPIMISYVVQRKRADLYVISVLSQAHAKLCYVLHLQGTAQKTERNLRH